MVSSHDNYYNDNSDINDKHYGYNDNYYLEARHTIKGYLDSINISLEDHIDEDDWNRMSFDERKQFLRNLGQKLIDLEVTFAFYAYSRAD